LIIAATFFYKVKKSKHMKLSLTQKNLLAGLHIVERAVGKNATLAIIENICLRTKENTLQLSATNLEIGVITQVPAKIENEGEITISAKRFVSYVQSLPEKNIDLFTEKNFLKIKSKSGEASFITNKAKEFPVIPEVKGKLKITLPANKLKKMLGQTIGACALTETRPAISGVYWLFNSEKADQKQLSIVATDGYRLAERILKMTKLPELTNENNSFILPRNTASELERLINTEHKDVVVNLDNNQVKFIIGSSTSIVSRLIEGTFPNYKAIIPENFESRQIVTRDELKDAVSRTSLFSADKTQEMQITMEPKKNQIKLQASSSETGEAETLVKALNKSDAANIDFKINHRYLTDILNWLDDDEIVLEAQDSAKPIVVKPKTKSDYVYLIMPLKN
jgi:DNA polymerase III subunit beta